MPRPPHPAALLAALLIPPVAHAAVVRGKVTTPLGVPVPGSRVQLVLLTGGSKSVADAVAGLDGSYELRTDLGGRFLLLTTPSITAPTLTPQIGQPFYAGRTDLLTRNIALDTTQITPRQSAQQTLTPTPVAQLATPVTQLRPDQFLPHATLLPLLRQTPSLLITQFGPTGAPAELYLRGAPPTATQFLLDGQPAESLGGAFDLATLSPTGLAALTTAPAIEITPSPLPLNTIGAQAGSILLHTAEPSTLRPALTYSGDAGPLAALRNEILLTLTPTRASLAAGFSRFDTTSSGDPQTPRYPFHLATAFTNLGYHISSATSLSATARQDVSASPIPHPQAFSLTQPQDKLSHQNLYAAFAFETVTTRGWTNRLTYALARKRTQLQTFVPVTAGLPVTLRGANGYTATGTAAFPTQPARQDLASNRDTLTYQTGYTVKPWLATVFQARYQDERGLDRLPTQTQTVERHHLNAALAVQGQFLHRIFYEASGFLDQSSLLHLTGAPRLGLTYVPIRPGLKPFHGTALHATLAAGLREPSLAEQLAVPNPAAPHTRSLDFTVDQQILTRLHLRATYFHTQFAHEFEPLTLTTSSQTLALRTQGFESTLDYNPYPRLALHAAYTYLASLTEQSAATPTPNPAFPALRIGALTALAGARPFHRPPNSGAASIAYTGQRLTATFQAAVTGRSDSSTNLIATPSLLLPNRNLSPGYTDLSAAVTYQFSRRFTAYTQLTNLLDNRQMAPIGYTSSPFLIRTGLRIRLGGE